MGTAKVWRFTTSDVTAPTVTSTSPSDGATGVAVTATVSGIFSKAMDDTTITTSTFTLKTLAGASVTGTVAYNSSTKTATFTPGSSLLSITTYEATIASTVKDTAGNELGNAKTWNFTTADITAPTVSSVLPASGATAVDPTAEVSAVFSKDMDSTTINTTNFTLTDPNSANIAGTVGYNSTTKKGTFTQSANLPLSATIAALISRNVKDSVGNTMGTDYTWSFTTRDISSWAFVDGNGTNGLNKDSTRLPFLPQLTVFNSKLYAMWYETNGSKYQARVAVYSGSDTSPTWTFVDGGGANGINYNTAQSVSAPQLTVLNSKLYATWTESNGTNYQIRMLVYNGNDSSPIWTFIDGNGANGINKSSAQDGGSPQITVFNSKLYATWYESNGVANQIRVVVYNGNDSSPACAFVDGNGANGINKDATKLTAYPQLTVFSSKLYITWYESNGTKTQTRVAVYNGNDTSPTWTFVDGNGTNGINKSTAQDAIYSQLTVLSNKLYATWVESNGTKNQIRMAVYNGNDTSPTWTFVDGNGTNGINKSTAQDAFYPQLTVFNNKSYAIWEEHNGVTYQVRVAVGQ